MIDWKQYTDYIFCLHYLNNDRLNEITKTLTDINIDVNDSSFFSFIYDIDHCIFKDQMQSMKEEAFNLFNEKAKYYKLPINNPKFDYVFYIALNIYKTLKIAQYFKYDRIIIFEDDIKFLKDTNYIINAMNFVKEQDFDICICQTTFVCAFHGIKSYLLENDCEDLGNDMFLRTKEPLGLFGAGFTIFTNKGINKLLNYIESTNLLVAIDTYDGIRDIVDLDTLFALKPLCIQKCIITEWDDERRKEENINMNIEEYNNE